ncbi:mRNA degradation protein pet127, mitochondrial [Neolecta irregularis DAH-3]|uniref:mRNA degradation protein pet127, mitochondrial n=1 Tax=Neolecta irregularis (strain DAH-3) TaxID=1198029 RepID=A0A1U7LNL3_NEOID|nr:mRNA degradation protein pet127, mitochondrial [Neolecta irregularis DAH-3]|eukprot:OLL24260.1 mRNA degradation protein pet127, mitochondrial [Neolecta irregularis DAH-3]
MQFMHCRQSVAAIRQQKYCRAKSQMVGCKDRILSLKEKAKGCIATSKIGSMATQAATAILKANHQKQMDQGDGSNYNSNPAPVFDTAKQTSKMKATTSKEFLRSTDETLSARVLKWRLRKPLDGNFKIQFLPRSGYTTAPEPLNVTIDGSVTVQTLSLKPENIHIKEVILPGQKKVAGLAHGLDRVLFNPGVTYMRDPRSNVYNFDPYIEKIMPKKEFDYDALFEYITSSRDTVYFPRYPRQHNCTFVGSTSSMTATLSHFHFLLSSWRSVSISKLSSKYGGMLKTFTRAQRAPSSIFLRCNNGIYSIDADKSLDTDNNVLSWLGRSMEKMLTVAPSVLEKYRKTNSHTLTPSERNEREVYHFSTCGDILMRSQLDCYDPRLPGSGIFDLKTRAVIAVRMDIANAEEHGSGYEIRGNYGEYESFEREYYDLIRSAFLKYSLQVRIGNMDGIFVAFHNTNRIFGFQYISLEEMDCAIHGSHEHGIGNREFKLSITILEDILQKATKRFPNQSMRMMFDTDPGLRNRMYVIVEAMSETRINEHQAGAVRAVLESAQGIVKPEAVEKIEEKLHELELTGHDDEDSKSKEPSKPTEPEKSNGAKHVTIRDVSPEIDKDHLSTCDKVFGLVVETDSFVNETLVEGSPMPTSKDDWQVEVQYSEMKHPMNEYIAMLQRRLESYTISEKDETPNEIQDRFIQELRALAQKGREWREQHEKEQQGKPLVVFKTRWGQKPVALD